MGITEAALSQIPKAYHRKLDVIAMAETKFTRR